MEIILASASPRRKELLEQIGLEFRVVVSDVEEKTTTTVPYGIVEELSRQKAEAVLQKVSQDPADGEQELLVIGADTIVACDGKILGKPRSSEEAAEMLKRLQGHCHEVYTGVTLLYCTRNPEGEQMVTGRTFHETTKVHFYPMTELEIAAYVATRDPMDKAGAYGIQGFCARYISGIEGDYNNVVGLPVGRLYQEVKQWL